MQALKLFCFVLGLSTFNAAQADIIAVKGGIDYWHYNADLQQPSSVGAQAELENDPVPFYPISKLNMSIYKLKVIKAFQG